MSNMLQKLNIKGFSDASIKALNKNHLWELIHLPGDYIIEKLGEANGTSFINAMYNLINNPIKDYIIMGSLGFTSIAHKKWESILNHITICQLYSLYITCKTENEFREKIISVVPRIGEITSWTIVREFPFFEKDIIEIIDKMNIIDSFGKSNEGKLQIRFTGIRNKQLSELLCNAGYDADDSSSVTKKTDILLVPYEGFSSSKTKKVSETCKIVPIVDFIKNIEKYLDDEKLSYKIVGAFMLS